MTFVNLLNDSIIRIKNSQASKQKTVNLKKSKMSLNILKVLRSEGYLRGFTVEEKTIKVLLKYYKDKPAIREIKYHSQLNSATNISYKKLKYIYKKKENNSGLSTMILSTPFGILTGFECLAKKIGGKHLLTVL